MPNWRAAVILTHNRPYELWTTAHCIGGVVATSAVAQVDQVIIMANASPGGAIPQFEMAAPWYIARDDHQPPNLAHLMNLGLNCARAIRPYECRQWDVAILCDDAPPPVGWFDAVTGAMDASGARLGCTHSHLHISQPIFKDRPDHDISNRLTGWAFVLRESLDDERPPLRLDTGMRWWWQDTDLDWTARLNGGMVIAPGPIVPNVHPNDYTSSRPDCADRIHFDRLHFAEKWAAHGGAPW